MNTTNLYVYSFGPVQELFDAAREVAEKSETANMNLFNFAKLRRAVERVEEAARVSNSLEAVREWAREQYVDQSCDIDIDESNFTHHNGENGYWVGAWLWVPEDYEELRKT